MSLNCIFQHTKYVRKAQEASKETNFLLIGDSIIERMQYSTLWSEKIKKLGCLNFGIGGDRCLQQKNKVRLGRNATYYGRF